ncbi:MAG TPA: ABC transporter ATP-binding protein [Bacteroidales bacterium]|nr:MAG: ABC transporter ATP-binding protein [Bacteroidetes bacterium GWF2_33_38]OFY76244.1 MAG: ABC transporter ATP-binding protein [Bacteroidetes bacterium RIFOXYA12_FULL_33_9]OFY84995.1 MAG: ABC transporter ATP-binding protein [Bacteroidetes bacterium RIFOXYA2_FULL_33_7]HBF87416.1 ABC transporter ATP-binding protein [Bacteroidales bacterium]
MNLFEAHNVVKKYANHLALDNVSINVPKGSIFGLLGPNGAGKTTLIRIINQITAPDSGDIFFNGEKLKSHHVEQIGYLPEERGLYKKMKVGEQALYLAQLKGLSKKDALKKLKYWFEKFEIQAWWDKKVEELSKGMQQKVQFIVTILHEPKLLIFDEPFSGFDPINTNLLKQEILYLREQGATIIFSTHNMSSVEEVCDNIALINKSKKILDGSVHDIRNQFKGNTLEIQFKGKPNLLEATLTPDYEIVENNFANDITNIKIKLLREIKTNNLISHVLPFGEIISFREMLPSMNDIFIRAVEETNEIDNKKQIL